MTTETNESTGGTARISPRLVFVIVLLPLWTLYYFSFDICVWLWFRFLAWFLGVPQ